MFTVSGTGVPAGNITLQDEDVIKIEPYGIWATITGGVKNSGKFELLKTETLQTLIDYAGGFTENEYPGVLTVFRYTDKARTVLNVEKSRFASFNVSTGDSVLVISKYNKFDNRVDIRGSVYVRCLRTYRWHDLKGLIAKQMDSKKKHI
jgi:protein involved in polysaccharide export with SLBB domain